MKPQSGAGFVQFIMLAFLALAAFMYYETQTIGAGIQREIHTSSIACSPDGACVENGETP